MMTSNDLIRFAFAITLLLSSGNRDASAVDYVKDIAPIFEESCIDCHGPDKEKSGLRLDQRALMLKGGDTGIATIVPGDWEGSYLMEVVTHLDEEMAMPPEGDPLSKEQIKLLEEWVNAGAEWPGQMNTEHKVETDHWSFQPVIRPDVPESEANAIDYFLNRKLKESGLEANAAADPRSLIRRVSVILTGLPPQPDRVKQFVDAYPADPDTVYAELVDELLASPHFGERWAQHWLDVIRWAETNGSEANLYRKNAWIYRDYVIRAFNEDIPYDRFITEQLAGDQLGVGEATGFLVAGPHVPAATVGREPTAIRQARADRVDEIMQTIGASMLGVTVSCARCHNHKFDPISIQDYYSLTAVFQGVEFGGRYPEFNEKHPRVVRAKELRKQMGSERNLLEKEIGYWEEDFGGFVQMHFPETKTKALRVEFDKPSVFIDELQVYPSRFSNENIALASHGTTLAGDETMLDPGSPPERANDGKFGTMIWKSRAPKDSKDKPFVEIRFKNEETASRFRFSSNREYYFETDYLDKKAGALPGYRILTQTESGEWEEIANTKTYRETIAKNAQLKASAKKLNELIYALGEEGPQHAFVGSFERPDTTYVLHRGSPENPRDEVVPAGFEVMDGDLELDNGTPEADRRLKYAEWLTQPDHPLTSRVMMNRVWHHLFGSGIVPTSSDFGLAGAPPSHPELLDWLASEFVAEDWSVKTMIREMVMTEAFRRSNTPNEESENIDAGAALLWRYPPQRVEAEVIRDGILQASGKLNDTIGGRSFRIHNVKKTYAQWEVVDNHGTDTWRRMIYQERMRRVDDQIFTAFDFPDCGQVRAKRPVSTTPLQALNLMNSPFVVEQSAFIAERALGEADREPAAAVDRCFQLLLKRLPREDERQACLSIAESNGLEIVCRSLINSNEFAFLP
ncbi:PSD1 and planctomycete cytochrome C domain-containing protein [Verrucomicrobiales bacterium BCK34]|nr:PSD1 and planctomycete cytochrome C domain-containing protein [Verrucomicrobiales bacterium BCK34]